MEDRHRYRAWDNSTGTMFLDFEKDERFIALMQDPDDWKHITLIQCTGHKDKHEVLIYEGDVVRVTMPYPDNIHTGVIRWTHAADYDVVEKDYGEDSEFICSFGLDGAQYEIIGNMYQGYKTT